ncbi:hypothetical protein P280DRAFT_523065 [Massarina eburnea CBS 473.64]|uniref:Uncharacterized protein n=1 Tax=Massarina eburnea CBS 473.64 TaxID=1395130 RepID=A0A6A6RLY3_9PLEO|nr:hypothetical protein P280DRAFT_523065 [Massarina eburnea CBS 473.64]
MASLLTSYLLILTGINASILLVLAPYTWYYGVIVYPIRNQATQSLNGTGSCAPQTIELAILSFSNMLLCVIIALATLWCAVSMLRAMTVIFADMAATSGLTTNTNTTPGFCQSKSNTTPTRENTADPDRAPAVPDPSTTTNPNVFSQYVSNQYAANDNVPPGAYTDTSYVDPTPAQFPLKEGRLAYVTRFKKR